MSLTLKGEIVMGYLEKFPDAPSSVLARMAHRDHPLHFESAEAARTVIRYYRGAAGRRKLKYARAPRTKEKSREAMSIWGSIDEGIKELKNTDPVIVTASRVLILSDIHVPFQDRGALTSALDDGLSRGADAVILNGDFLDCYHLSRFEKDPGIPGIEWEIELGRKILDEIAGAFKKVYWKIGNHEERLEKYLKRNAPALLGIPGFSWTDLMGLGQSGVELVEPHRHFEIGGLTVWHGHEFGARSSVAPARKLYLTTGGIDSLCGHFHRAATFIGKDARGNVVRSYSSGCLCDLRPKYMFQNNWSHGYAFVEQDDGSYECQLL